MPVSSERAREMADDYLSRVSPGTQAGEAETFYGYYTLHAERDGRITGMLSVNGYSGEVCYHTAGTATSWRWTRSSGRARGRSSYTPKGVVARRLSPVAIESTGSQGTI